MQESQDRADKLRLARKAKIVAPLPKPYYGMTPQEINRCVKGITKKEKSTPKFTPAIIAENNPIKVKKKPIPNQNNKHLLELPIATIQPAIEYPVPDWFTSKNKVEVSIIVPLYKSAEDVSQLVRSWDLSNDGVKVEFIFVDDECPQNSKDHVVIAWSKRQDEIKKPIGKIYYSPTKQGMAAMCNIGAKHASGDYLIFLNPTYKPSQNWLRPLLRLARQPDVGIVTGLSVNEEIQTVENAGSEWNWELQKFVSVGKASYNGKLLMKPFQLNNCPSDISQLSEREAISMNCMCVKKKLFSDLGGFNLNYKTNQWFGWDFSLAVKEMGLKIFYQPNSKLSGSGIEEIESKQFHRDAIYFANKWIATERIDRLVKDRRKEPNMEIRSIVIKREAAYGDVLLAAAVAPALKKKYPGVSIVFNTNCSAVLKDNPFIDRIANEEQISDRSFQIYFNLDLAYEYRPETNILKAYADAVGVEQKDCATFLKTEPIEGLPEKFIVIHAGKTAWVGRDWSPAKFDILAKRLRKADHCVVCVGTNGDHLVSADLDLRGKTSVNQLAYIMQKATAFVGIDSFPMHVAQVFNTPGVCFFGAIKPETRIFSQNMTSIMAQGLSCLGCHHRQQAPCTVTNCCETVTQDCINLLGIEQMWKKVISVLEKGK